MPTAHPINIQIVQMHSGDTQLYRLDPPLGELRHVIVWTEAAQRHMPARAVAVAATPWGSVQGPSLRPVAEYSHGWEPNHAGLLWLMGGYAIGEFEEPEVQPAPDPEQGADA